MVPATTSVFIMDQNRRKVLRIQTIHYISLKISPYPVMAFLYLISIIGDNAFGINKTLMNTFSTRNMDYLEMIFNSLRVVEYAFGVLSFADDHEPDTKDMQENNRNLCYLHNLIRLRYPTTHNNLMDLEDKNQDVIPGAWRKDRVLLDVYHERARNVGTQGGRQIRKYLSHYFTLKAGSVPW